MISAAIKALEQMFSAPFRAVLFKSLGLTFLLFIGLGIAVQLGLTAITFSSVEWTDFAAGWLAGLGAVFIMIVAGFFLIGPVTALFAGLFLDTVAERVEEKHYPGDRPGSPMPVIAGLTTALQFAAIILLVHLSMLPLLLFGLGAFGMFLGNAYLLGREYFQMIGMRHLPPKEARAMRKRNAGRIFGAGFIPAALAFVPLGNLIMPLFTTAYMTHIFKRVQRDEEAIFATAQAQTQS